MKNLHFFIVFTVLILVAQLAFAQGPDTLWTKKYGGTLDDKGYSVQQTTEGGYIITGYTESYGAGLHDMWLIKTNATGDTLWTRTYGGAEYDYAYHVQQTSDGGYLLIGETNSFNPTYWNAWIIKTDSLGDTLWTSVVGTGRHYFARSGLETSDGEFIFTGRTKASAAGEEDLWLVKLDSSGDTLWTKRMGGNDNEQGVSIQQTNNGGFIIAGITESFGAGDNDVWLIRTDSSGDTIWTRTYGGTNSDYASDVKQTGDNGFIIAGATRSFGHVNNYNDVWLIKTNSNGDTSWTRTFGGSVHDGAFAVQQTLDGGYVLVGYKGLNSLDNDVWLIKTNASGDSLWEVTFSLSSYDYGRSVEQTNDEGYIITGEYYQSLTNSRDVWLIKTAADPNGIEPDKDKTVPETFILKQNYPNPFNPITHIRYGLPKTADVKIEVFNILGQKISTLVDTRKTVGYHKIDFDASNLNTGIYLYRIQAGDHIEVKKMVLMK